MSRNTVTRTRVILAVILQHVIQTVLGYLFLEEDLFVDHHRAVEGLSQNIWTFAIRLFGSRAAAQNWSRRGEQVVYFMYWWGIPMAQFVYACFLIDTWQYFFHRFMHINKFLYRHLHSWHHRLYVPYAFGALYNHPLEGILLDTIGTIVAHHLAGLSIRQDILIFSFATLKTVDDHCGYSLPFDPLQMISGNNADYHDIHHQQIGIKSNFSQPFFMHWDVILGTRLTRKDIEERRGRRQLHSPKVKEL